MVRELSSRSCRGKLFESSIEGSSTRYSPWQGAERPVTSIKLLSAGSWLAMTIRPRILSSSGQSSKRSWNVWLNAIAGISSHMGRLLQSPWMVGDFQLSACMASTLRLGEDAGAKSIHGRFFLPAVVAWKANFLAVLSTVHVASSKRASRPAKSWASVGGGFSRRTQHSCVD